MPRKPAPILTSRLSAKELDICVRFREIRMRSGMHLKAFAISLGIPIPRLKSYERGRAPIRWLLALKASQVFNVNQRWLATGERPMMNHVPIPQELQDAIPDRMLFSVAYADHLSPLVERVLAGLSAETLDQIPWNYAVGIDRACGSPTHVFSEEPASLSDSLDAMADHVRALATTIDLCRAQVGAAGSIANMSRILPQ